MDYHVRYAERLLSEGQPKEARDFMLEWNVPHAEIARLQRKYRRHYGNNIGAFGRNPLHWKECDLVTDEEMATMFPKPDHCTFDDPCDCMQQIWPFKVHIAKEDVFTTELTNEEASASLQQKVDSIKGRLADLRSKLSAHADTVHNKWKKKGVKKRTRFLQAVLPDLPASKYFQIEQVYGEKFWSERAKHRDNWLLPYFTTDVLSEDPYKLLTLLHHRTESDPERWVLFDCEMVRLGFHTGALELRFNMNGVRMEGTEYGRLDERYIVAEWHSWRTIGFALADVVLDAQNVLAGRLLQIVDALVHDVTDQNGSKQWSQLIPKLTAERVAGATWSDFGLQPFLPSPELDLKTMRGLAEAKKREAYDEIWLRQTDPEYVQHLIRLTQDSPMSERFRDGSSEVAIWTDITNEVIAKPQHRANEWSWLAEECDFVSKVASVFGHQFSSRQALPEVLEVAIGALRLLVMNSIRGLAEDIQDLVPNLRTFDHHFSFIQRPTSMYVMIKDSEDNFDSDETKKAFRDDTLFWALTQLRVDNNQSFAFNRALVHVFLDEHLAKSKKDAARVNQRLYDWISDLKLLDAFLNSIDSLTPRPLPVSWDVAEQFGDDRKAWRYLRAEIGSAKGDLRDRQVLKLKDFAACRWPSGKRDKDWYRKAMNSRKALKAFWDEERAVDRAHLEGCGKISKADIDSDIAVKSYDLRPEYLELMKQERDTLQALLNAQDKPKVLSSVPVAYEPQTVWGTEQPSEPVKRSKAKGVKPAASPTPPDALQSRVNAAHLSLSGTTDDEPGPNEAPQHIAVKAESLRIFNQMYSAGDCVEKSSVGWKEVVAALVDAGLHTSQGEGSALTFLHSEKGSISFHRPHPDPTVYPIMLHVMGKRLAKHFGWDGSVFVERKK